MEYTYAEVGDYDTMAHSMATTGYKQSGYLKVFDFVEIITPYMRM